MYSPRVFFTCIWLVMLPNTSYAYLDPGTGSLLFSALMTLVSAIVFWGKSLIHNIKGFVFRLAGWSNSDTQTSDLVIYSEGGQYWNLFRPIVEACEQNKLPLTFLTSDIDDPALQRQSNLCKVNFIGKSNRAYMRLNMLKAKICIMTTPGLDVLQIKRSKGVEHYIHLLHAPTTGTYQLFSFDYFDSVMCTGPHQVLAIRELERKRQTKVKTLFETGCCYMDVLADNLESKSNIDAIKWRKSDRKTVLIAPTWGQNGLLTRCGEAVLSTLLDSEQYNIIVRPHPQSRVVEAELLSTLKEKFSKYGNQIVWDDAPSGFESLASADIMVSDFSGVIFDFALVFEKPVIVISFDLSLKGLDANDLDGGLWELRKLDQIGRKIDLQDISTLPLQIEEVLEDKEFVSRIHELRAESLFNYRETGAVAFEQISGLLAKIN